MSTRSNGAEFPSFCATQTWRSMANADSPMPKAWEVAFGVLADAAGRAPMFGLQLTPGV